jgi:hypothetical protein
MLLEGEKLRDLVASARGLVHICAPFIKLDAFKALITVLPDGVRLRVTTRWRPEEVAMGVSDLAVFDTIIGRPNTSMRILNSLHAKLYLADDKCLIGSANVTRSALGWIQPSNVELLTSIDVQDSAVQYLIHRIDAAPEATLQMQQEVAAAAARYKVGDISPERFEPLTDTEIGKYSLPWVPKCSVPDKIFAVYVNSGTDHLNSDTKEDAISDIEALALPPDLNEEDFYQYVSKVIVDFPSIQKIISRIPSRLNDSDAVSIVQQLRPDMNQASAFKQWTIIRDWIDTFLGDLYEVAPDSFVVRLKN